MKRGEGKTVYTLDLGTLLHDEKHVSKSSLPKHLKLIIVARYAFGGRSHRHGCHGRARGPTSYADQSVFYMIQLVGNAGIMASVVTRGFAMRCSDHEHWIVERKLHIIAHSTGRKVHFSNWLRSIRCDVISPLLLSQ